MRLKPGVASWVRMCLFDCYLHLWFIIFETTLKCVEFIGRYLPSTVTSDSIAPKGSEVC